MKIPHSEFLLTDEDWMFERLERWLVVLRASLHGARQPLQVEISRVRSEVERPFSAPKNFEPIALGAEWGQAWDYAWLRFIGTIPADWKGQPVDALIDLEGEVSVFTLSGEITRRLTWGSAFGVPCQVEDIALTPACDGGEPITVLVQAWASSIVGVDQPADPLPDDPLKDGLHRARIKTAHLAVARPEARRLLWDAEVVLGLAREMPAFSARRAKALQALMDACILWQDNPERSMVARARLQPELARPATSSSLEAVAVGHAHIDTGWLWRVDDSIGKCARTFASQIELIEKYPTYRFGASSAQHYAFVKEHHPDLHRRIQAAVKAGRWELQGGMWIEPDTNLPSGEALIRQLLYGQQFFRREFGQECTVAWLPDVFGLSAALPQILARSGIRYLLTKKPHWGRTNRYPDTAFRWAGHDGSEIIAHLLPQARDYNGLMRVQDMVAAERGFAEKARFDRFVYTVGIGDGGGGPSELHVERALRLASLEGVPRVRFGASDEVFAQFEAGRDQLKRRRGDLYVEGHRGTYTTQARLKRDNRKLEILLGQIEQLYCYLPTVQYPGQHFARLWQTVLLHQFHDILPGSGIRRVIEDAEAGNTQVFAELADLQTRFADGLPARAGTLSLLNTLGHPWTGSVTSDSLLVRADGRPAGCAQREPDGRVITQVTLPALCFTPLVTSAVAAEPVRTLLEPVLENEHLRCAFNAAGELVSVFDKHAGRECFAPGAPGNRLSLYVDRPIDWDAWDIDPLYRQECVATAESAGPWLGWAGPARSVLVFTLRIGGSTLTQRCVLAADARRVDFETEVVWSERHKMLRVGFAYPGLGTVSRCEIQHGFFDRPTHQNTSYEQACFEVPCHRYACLLGQDGGLAVLNDSKYGVRIEENLVELALLRSSTHPDHSADLGTHRFTYSYRPLATKAEALDLPAEAACLNVAPLRLDGKDASTLTPPVALTAKGVAVDAIKRAEGGSALVLRLVNVSGEGGSVTLPEGQRWRAADMMERPLTPTAPIEGAVSLRPFEVVTLLRDVG
jgi:alpha-mannosidase